MKKALPAVVKDHFTTNDLRRFANLSLHMVNYLCRHDILEPTLSRERRRGLKRRFSYEDLLLARAVSRLLQGGVSIVLLRRALETLRNQMSRIPLDLFSVRHVVITGNVAYLSEPGKPLINLSSNGQLAFHFVLDSTDLPVQAIPRKSRRASA